MIVRLSEIDAMEAFSPTEQHHLTPFFTNLTASIFGLKLPQEVAGALFSRYSRSNKSLRRIFLDEFLGNADLPLPSAQTDSADQQTAALAKARAFYERVLIGYGDDSVAQLGGAHIACENISNVAANLLEDARIGIAPLEKSTRYVRFDQKGSDGDYLFAKEPTIMASRHRDEYLAVMRLLFDTYSAQMEPMIACVRALLPIETIEWKHPQTGEPLTYREAEKDEQLQRWADTAYRSTVRTQACDILRSYLPAATLTNVGIFGVGQAFEHLLNKLYSHELAEARSIAAGMHESLNHLIPSFVKRARRSEYLADTQSALRSRAASLLAATPVTAHSQAVTLVDYEHDAEEKLLAALLYPHTNHSLTQLRTVIATLSAEQRETLLTESLQRRRHRRDKPGRAFEQVFYTFDVIGNLGLYRDLHRHRLLTQERQNFTTAHGYDTPDELASSAFKSAFERGMEAADQLYRKISQDHPQEAQYVVPFAYRVRWSMKMNLREAVHIGELRTMPQGHPDYRRIVQEMWRQIERVHPALARAAAFIDWNTYRLGRLQSEMRSEYKRATVSGQPADVEKTERKERE